jgi:hypothetical protein
VAKRKATNSESVIGVAAAAAAKNGNQRGGRRGESGGSVASNVISDISIAYRNNNNGRHQRATIIGGVNEEINGE